jgi:hypothetical protein
VRGNRGGVVWRRSRHTTPPHPSAAGLPEQLLSGLDILLIIISIPYLVHYSDQCSIQANLSIDEDHLAEVIFALGENINKVIVFIQQSSHPLSGYVKYTLIKR